MKFDWEAEIALLQDPLYRETRLVALNSQLMAQKHAYIFYLYRAYNKNDDLMMWILQVIADFYNEMDANWPSASDGLREQLQKYMTQNINNDEILAERLAIMALLR